MQAIDAQVRAGALYRAVWRCHFFAGLAVLPFLVMLAITGGAYLFKSEIDHLVYRGIEDVPLRVTAFMPEAKLVRRVEAALDARVLQITPPATKDRAVRLMVRVSSGVVITAFADPYDGHVTGTTDFGGVMRLVRKIHSLQKFGFWASCLIEIAAGWAIVLAATGLYLWWPRGAGRGGVVSIRGKPAQRIFWRDLHAVTGVFSAAVILFLALTGMPWSMFWGARVQQWATTANLNEPAPPGHVTPDWMMAETMPDMPHTPHAADAPAKPEMPWAMETMAMPRANPANAPGFIDLDHARAIFHSVGMDPTAAISLPDGPAGPYFATWRPDRVEDTRVVYLDQYTGRVLGDVGFKDYGPVGKAIEWGIAVHQGQEFGAPNRYLMLTGCIAIVLLAVSATVMWWRRRPPGTLGSPPPVGQPRVMVGMLCIVGLVGLLFPLVGATLLGAVLLDRIAWAARRLRVRNGNASR